jgi:hypothetical protein
VDFDQRIVASSLAFIGLAASATRSVRLALRVRDAVVERVDIENTLDGVDSSFVFLCTSNASASCVVLGLRRRERGSPRTTNGRVRVCPPTVRRTLYEPGDTNGPRVEPSSFTTSFTCFVSG